MEARSLLVKWKIIVSDAVLKSKLLHGLESAMLNTAALRKIDSFQLKGLRRILGMSSSYVDRRNTNARVLEEASRRAGGPNAEHTVQLYSEAYKKGRRASCTRILARSKSDPVRHTTLDETDALWNFVGKRIGRPRDKWAAEGFSDLWESLRTNDPQHHVQ